MRLYLMQHGEAMWEEHDPARPLTEKGWADTRKVVQPWREQLPAVTITEADGLDPTASPEVWWERLGRETEDVLLVGHLPHLARLAALLLCGSDNKEVIMFQNGGIVCLHRSDGDWSVRWVLTPEVV